MQQAAYDARHELLYGDGGILSTVMDTSERTEGLASINPDLREPLERARALSAQLIDELEHLKPRDFDFAAMEAACPDGPIENFSGLEFGFDATRRCGSLAIDDETRRGYTQILQRAEPPEAAG